MKKKFLTYSSVRLMALLFIVVLFCGCETWRGFNKDIDFLKEKDQEFQEDYW